MSPFGFPQKQTLGQRLSASVDWEGGENTTRGLGKLDLEGKGFPEGWVAELSPSGGLWEPV